MGKIYWIIPFIISIILFYQNLKVLLEYAMPGTLFPLTFETLLPFVMAILWYAMVQAFHFALKTEREYNKFVEESHATNNEARFITLMEKRQTKRERKERKLMSENKSRKISISEYNFPPEKK